MNTLLPSSFADEARLRSHLARDLGAEDDVERRLVWSLNRAIAWMEKRAGRRLKARNYRTQVTTTTSGTTAAGSTTINVASSASLKVGDDLLAAGLDTGTQVLTIASASAITTTKKTLAEIASGTTLTAGSRPLVLMNEEDCEPELYAPEYPLLEANLYALYWVDEDGVRWAADLTAVQVDEQIGRVSLKRELGRLKTGRYEFECRAGYEEPSAAALGDAEDWEALVGVQLRVAEVFFSDDSLLRGRASAIGIGSVNISAADLNMPADIEAALLPYRRLNP